MQIKNPPPTAPTKGQPTVNPVRQPPETTRPEPTLNPVRDSVTVEGGEAPLLALNPGPLPGAKEPQQPTVNPFWDSQTFGPYLPGTGPESES